MKTKKKHGKKAFIQLEEEMEAVDEQTEGSPVNFTLRKEKLHTNYQNAAIWESNGQSWPAPASEHSPEKAHRRSEITGGRRIPSGADCRIWGDRLELCQNH